ncbi:MAG TPA: PsiF family protein [Usitatibacter sp.]|nr:PsiF family protein [Usitatibacter sp.]
MKAPLLALASLVTASALAAFAADAPKEPPKKEPTPQQQRMADCSHESKGMKGDEHKKFMSECLKSKETPAEVKAKMTAAAAKPTQQDKMKSCNAEASKKDLKGDERKKFMSECLKG